MVIREWVYEVDIDIADVETIISIDTYITSEHHLKVPIYPLLQPL